VANFPDVVATNDKAIYVGNSVELEAFGTGESYQWTPEYNTSCRFCRRVTVSPRLNTVYYVTNTNEHGCSTTDSVRVQVDQEYYFGVPDAFSPNGDGENDFLYVRGNGIEFIEFYVYDRFGQLVFESRDQDIGWDGTYKGQRVHPGVYVYYAKVTLLNGRQDILQGDVTLVR
jgi:gliding motility-associated-like protein